MAASDRPVFPDGPDARRHRITARGGHAPTNWRHGSRPASFGISHAIDSRSPSFSTTMRARRTA